MEDDVLAHLKDCDEIWHAGDIGDISVIEKLETLKIPLQVVFGNIDTKPLQIEFHEDICVTREGIKIFMTHIGGYPPRYRSRVREILVREKPNLYICGHSHILKVMPDRELDLLHMNPGAIGHHGIHQMRTLLKFEINNQKISNVNVVELGRRGKKYVN